MISSPTRQYLKALTTAGMIGALTIHLALAAEVWRGPSHLLAILCSFLIAGAWNAAVTLEAPRMSLARSSMIRLVMNLASCLVLGAYLGWPVSSWMFLPFLAAFDDGLDVPRGWLRLLAVVAVWDLVALSTGAHWPVALAFTALALICHHAGAVRRRMMESVLEVLSSKVLELSTAREELEVAHQQVLASEKLAAIGLLAAGIAHEINNPMSYINANVRALFEDLKDAEVLTPELADYRDEVLPDTIAGIDRVNAIVADLRHFARGEVPQPAIFDVNCEVEAAVRIATPQLGPSQKIFSDLEPLRPLFGSGRQIGQVVLNLLINGIQALAPGGSVIVSTKMEGDAVKISVGDDGPGMSPETCAKIFQPFFTTKADGKGTGLGLSVAHGIVASHGGKIELASVPGRGSWFTICLPAPAAAAQGIAA